MQHIWKTETGSKAIVLEEPAVQREVEAESISAHVKLETKQEGVLEECAG